MQFMGLFEVANVFIGPEQYGVTCEMLHRWLTTSA